MALFAISGCPRSALPPCGAPAVAPPAPGTGPAPPPGTPPEPDALAVAPPGVEAMPAEEPPRPTSGGAPPTAALGPASIVEVQAATKGARTSARAGAMKDDTGLESLARRADGVDRGRTQTLRSRMCVARLLGRRRGLDLCWLSTRTRPLDLRASRSKVKRSSQICCQK